MDAVNTKSQSPASNIKSFAVVNSTENKFMEQKITRCSVVDQESTRSVNQSIAERQLVIRKPVHGYVIGHAAVRIVGNNVHLHLQAKSDSRGYMAKDELFEYLIPYLMERLKTSQTKILEALISAIEITPYLRKLTCAGKKKAEESSLELQTQVCLALLEKMRQGLSFFELTRLLNLLDCGNTNALECIHKHSDSSIYVYDQKFTIEALGDETFREISAALDAAKNPKKKCDYLIKRLISMEHKKTQSMACWQDIYNKIVSSQDDRIWEKLENITRRFDSKNRFIPINQRECCKVINLISAIGS